jgi:uncharacterized protein YyaL (SSP411 family)
MSEFRFSPRDNRAHEIAWMPWGAQAFERAQAEDRPILLSISAVWCHWCHVMDETSYSDPTVIAAINERFVPVRVDNDKRPDVNARYNMGGWPTTAFLSPDGSTLTGATYLTPQQMRRALDEIADFYRGNKDQIADRAAQNRARVPVYKTAARDDLRESMIARLIEELSDNYDDEFAGFGDAPKFPQPELLEFLLTEWRISREQRLYEMVARTMLAMARGGMYDHVEGGFFRYSTTRDWSVPHFEKMAEDHAGLLRVLAQLVLFAPNDFRSILVSATGYVRTVLRDPQTGFFAGSQDADEEYFALPLEERRELQAPFVDRTSYTNWTCALAGAFALAGRTLDDDALVEEALAALDAVHERLLDGDGLVYHFVAEDGRPQVRGLLTDQVAYARALIDAHEISGEARFLERALSLCDRILARFEADDGGFYDRIDAESTLGRLDFADRPIVDNGLLADTLLRLSTLTGVEAYRAAAERTLLLFARTYAAAGAFAATYGRALRRFLTPEVAVRIVGRADRTDEFREAAWRLPNPLATIRTVADSAAAGLGLPAQPQPAAYVCAGTTCGAPATEPAGVRAAYDALVG